MRSSDARMEVISAGAVDNPRSGNKKMHSDYLQVGRRWIVRGLSCASCVPASCFHIWFVSGLY